MNHIRAIGFDLFNTLIFVEPHAIDIAVKKLTESLMEGGVVVEHEPFRSAHLEAALQFLETARGNGRETHNRFWISAALETLGFNIPPDDPRISEAVEAYFSVFLDLSHPIPGTGEMLEALRGRYALGLLSNYTHASAARKIMDRLGLTRFFDVVLISGELGYRKPHPYVFRRLVEQLEVEKDQVLFVGDDPDADIDGALDAGLQPVWTTYVRDWNMPFAANALSGADRTPEEKVQRFSTWEEFFSLLEA